MRDEKSANASLPNDGIEAQTHKAVFRAARKCNQGQISCFLQPQVLQTPSK
jgi:hypothetical protein